MTSVIFDRDELTLEEFMTINSQGVVYIALFKSEKFPLV